MGGGVGTCSVDHFIYIYLFYLLSYMISLLNILPLHAVVMETGYLRGHWLGECGQQVIAFI